MKFLDRWRCLGIAASLLALAAAACSDDLGVSSSPALPDAPSLSVSTLCKSSGMAARTGPGGDINSDLNDYARALVDADESTTLACVDSAANLVTVKLKKTLALRPSYFGNCPQGTACGFNAGAVVALVFAAADRITARGGMTDTLASVLRDVEAAYINNDKDDGCPLQSTDNCMDGHSVAASGWGWIAAYRWIRGDDVGATAARDSTTNHVKLTFESACVSVFKEPPPGSTQLCRQPTDPILATDSTMGMNLGHQHQGYGFGLVTSVAAGILGYQVGGFDYQLSERDKTVARMLWREAQKRVVSDVAFATDCPSFDNPGGIWTLTNRTARCGGSEGEDGKGYRPGMYPLYTFYDREVKYMSTSGYLFNTVTDSLFPKTRLPNGFFTWGRYETYVTLTRDWWVTPPTHVRWVDAHAPRGWLDGFSGGSAVGWACDRDFTEGSVRVTLSAPGKKPITRRADMASEPGLDGECWGGRAHRYSIPIPADWQGLTVSASVTDYFGQRTVPIGCTGCVVPSVSVAWAQPSGVTWGPANTLTVAGYARYGSGTVKMEWRETTYGGNPAWIPAAGESVPSATNAGWSLTLPSSNYCRTFQVRAYYTGFVSSVFTYTGPTSGFCKRRVIWIQPSSTAGFGTPGALVVAGEAIGATPGTVVSMWYRNVSLGGAWVKATYDSNTDANGIWLNEIHNANPYHQYAVYARYDVVTTATCTYAGANNITWC